MSSYADMVRADGAISYWPLGETSGSALDLIGSNAAAASGTITRSQNSPIYEGAATLLGGGVFTKTTPVGLLSGANPTFSIEAWVKPTTALSTNGAGGGIFGYDGGASTVGVGFQIVNSGGTIFLWSDYVNAGNNQTITAAQAPIVGAWSHVVCQLVGSAFGYWLNGILQKTASISETFASPTRLMVGGRSDTGTLNWLGSIAGVAYYPRQLGWYDIVRHMHAGQTALYGPGAERIVANRHRFRR